MFILIFPPIQSRVAGVRPVPERRRSCDGSGGDGRSRGVWGAHGVEGDPPCKRWNATIRLGVPYLGKPNLTCGIAVGSSG